MNFPMQFIMRFSFVTCPTLHKVINTNLRASDLTKITAGMVKDKKAGDDLELKEKKTGKPRRITLNKRVISAIQALLLTDEHNDNQKPLFSSQRGHGPS
jgi:hypothetical protein